jgi:hypothetical protein
MNLDRNFLTVCKITLAQTILIGIILSLFSCGGNSPSPPPAFFVVRATYKTTQGQDLLNQTFSNSFKQSDIKVVSKIESNGIVKEVYYNDDDKGIEVYFDDSLKSNYFDLSIPSNSGKNPIETIITLSKTDTDTVTYTYGPTKFKAVPDKIYYNKKLVWEAVNIPSEGKFPPIIVVK